MSALARNNVQISGRPDGRPLVFAHGYGCDQRMWRHVAPAFEDEYRVVLLDHVGAGGSDLGAYHAGKYASVQGYADDIVEVLRELELSDVVLVGHSVAAMMAVLVERSAPELIGALVLVGPSARYVDAGDYVGGFKAQDIEELLELLDSNYLGWSSQMAPVIMGNPERPELSDELTESFCRTDPDIAKQFARVTFLSDNRTDLPHVQAPTLVLQCREDAIAPDTAGRFVAEQIPQAQFVTLTATGHVPHLSAPRETADAIAAFLS